MLKIIALVFITLTSVHAAVPSVEGLFRNPNSQDIDGDLIVLKSIVQKLPKEDEVTKPRFLKFIFSIENENRIQFLQVEYSSGEMKSNQIISTLYLNDLLNKVTNDELLERNLFYSYLLMYGTNSSKGISSILKKYSPNFISNKEAMNKDKVVLYERYKRYLQALKDEEEIKEELKSPLESENEEEVKRIKEIQAAKMYVDTSGIELVKEGRRFFLSLNAENISAKFTNEEHRLVSLKVTKGTSDVQTYFNDYILFNGRHELPKYILMKDQEKNDYSIRFTALSVFTNKGDSLSKRALEYKKDEEKNKSETKPATDSLSQNDQNADIRPIIIY